MDTRSKKLGLSIWFKIVAWAVCITSACGVVFTARGILGTDVQNAVPNYVDSYGCKDWLMRNMEQVWSAFYMPEEEALKREVDEHVSELNVMQDEEVVRVLSLSPVYAEGGNFQSSADIAPSQARVEEALSDTATTVLPSKSLTEDERGALAMYQQQRLTEIQEKYTALIENAYDKVKTDHRASMEVQQKALRDNRDVLYVMTKNGEIIQTNILGEGKNPLFVIEGAKVNGVGLYSADGDGGMLYDQMGEYGSLSEDESVIYVAMTEDAYAENFQAYTQNYEWFKYYLTWMIVCMVAFVAGFVWLMISAGRNMYDDSIKIGRADVVYLDIGFALMAILVVLFIIGAYVSMGSVYTFFYEAELDAVGVLGVCSCIAGAVSMMLLWGMSTSRRSKQGNAGEFTLAYVLFGGVSKAYAASGVQAKAVGTLVWYMIAGVAIMAWFAASAYCGSWLGALLGLVLIVIYVIASLRFVLKKAVMIKEIETGVEEIKGGNMEYVIPAYGNGNMDKVARGINNIAEGLASAVKQEVKSERMKTELITNISHDLKTPLTSILTYVDLMKKEKDISENAKKYLRILDMKSHRLKVLTDDLFEAAKASSGDMTVNKTRIELVQFMEQAMGELSDKMEGSGLIFISDISDEKMHVSADGKLLFRVIGNVIDNVVNYALPRSRVYISVGQAEETVCLVVKNISKNELNITEDELMERFVRGDSSRNTEGSGLGLAIAKNFMNLMGGQFIVEIDGDLFKVNICLPKVV